MRDACRGISTTLRAGCWVQLRHVCCVPHRAVRQTPPVVDPTCELRRDWDLLLLDVAQVRAWERLLFVACGDAWIVEEAWRRALKGYACGVDISPQRVARATALRGVPGKLEVKSWDGTHLPCQDRSFDRVISTFALRDCAEPATLLNEMHRVLQPGGEIYLLEFQRLIGGTENSTTEAFRAALEGAGFQDTHEVLRREFQADSSGGLAGVIVRARCATPPGLPHATERAPARPAA